MTRKSSRSHSLTVQPSPVRPTFGQTIKEGVAFGVGQSIAHRIVSGVLGGNTNNVSCPDVAKPEFIQCMKESNYDIEACKQYK